MKSKILSVSLLAMGLSALTAQAWDVSGVVSCPNGASAAGIVVFIPGVGATNTSANGAYFLPLPDVAATYTICVDTSTLPPGASVSGNDCTKFSVDDFNRFANVDFTLKGDFCAVPPPQGGCWLTGGGTIFKTKGMPTFSFGGVVNPGCSPFAAGGGNWNVIDFSTLLHFKGLVITNVTCSGVPDKSPKVNVNTIDFSGFGTLTGIGGNSQPEFTVCFTARAIDSGEPGAGKDALYLNVYDCAAGPTASFLLISTSSTPTDIAPVPLSTGNLQIHTTSCN